MTVQIKRRKKLSYEDLLFFGAETDVQIQTRSTESANVDEKFLQKLLAFLSLWLSSDYLVGC